jgi:hypothetical protein
VRACLPACVHVRKKMDGFGVTDRRGTNQGWAYNTHCTSRHVCLSWLSLVFGPRPIMPPVQAALGNLMGREPDGNVRCPAAVHACVRAKWPGR